MSQNRALIHYGVLGMKWGKRRAQHDPVRLAKQNKSKHFEELDRLDKEADDLYKKYEAIPKRDKAAKAAALKDYEDKDSEATAAYDKGDKAYKSELSKAREDRKQLRDDEKNPQKKMSDAELKSKIARMQLEQQYTKLSAPEKAKGQKYAEDIVLNAGKTVATAYVAFAMKKGVEAAMRAAMKK